MLHDLGARPRRARADGAEIVDAEVDRARHARAVVVGGVITTLLDHASGLAVFCSLPELAAIATLDLRIDYLRAAEPGCDLVGRAECYKLGAQVAFVRGSAWDRSRDDPFASVHATMMIGANASVSPVARAIRDRSGA
jgi:uncharacterized protein (TIGR00369 family)